MNPPLIHGAGTSHRHRHFCGNCVRSAGLSSMTFPLAAAGRHADGFSAMTHVSEEFFEQDPVTCARRLIGCRFEWHGCVARIVETEAYDSADDPACHTWFRPSAREFVSRQRPGDAYVYMNYGVHWLFNILVKGGDREGFVLFRAVEPLAGIERMRKRRPGAKDELLGAGPGRLTRALGIDGKAHGASFLRAAESGILLDGPVEPLAGPRIGISRARELPWRFGDPASRSLSRPFR